MKRSKIHFVDNRLQKIPVLALNFEMYLNAEVEIFHHLDEYSAKLEEEGKPDFFIIYGPLAEVELLQKINETDSEVLILGPLEEKLEGSHELDEFVSIKDLLRFLAEKLGVTAKEMAALEFDQYMKIENSFFERLIYSPCSVFIEKDGSYVEELKYGDSIDEKFLNSIDENSIFYIDAMKRLTFTNSFSDQFSKMTNLLTDSTVDLSAKTEKLEQVMDFISRDFKSGGMQPESVEIAESCIKTIIESSVDTPLLQKLKENMLARSSSIRSVISMGIAFVGNHVVNSLDWIVDDPEKNIATAAFFHDLILEDDIDLKVDTEELLESMSKNDEHARLISEHPKLMAKILEATPSISEQATQLVREHHGSIKGEGFLTDLDKLSPLSKIFIVSNYWAYMIYGDQELALTKEQIDQKLKDLFPGNDYLEIINAIAILNIDNIDELMEFLISGTKEEPVEETNLGKDLAELEEIISISGDLIDEESKEDLRAIGFYGEKANNILVKGSKELTEEDKQVIKGVGETINEVNQLVKGSPSNEEEGKFVVKGGLDGKLKEFREVVKGKSDEVDEIKKRALDIKRASVTDLMLAAMKGSAELVDFYISEDKASISRLDGDGRSALHYGAMSGNPEVCKKLIEHGAKINQLDGKRRTPIFFSVIKSKKNCFDFFIESKARLTQQSIGGVNIAMTAAKCGEGEMLKILLSNGVPPSATDSKGKGLKDYAKNNKAILSIVESIS